MKRRRKSWSGSPESPITGRVAERGARVVITLTTAGPCFCTSKEKSGNPTMRTLAADTSAGTAADAGSEATATVAGNSAALRSVQAATANSPIKAQAGHFIRRMRVRMRSGPGRAAWESIDAISNMETPNWARTRIKQPFHGLHLQPRRLFGRVHVECSKILHEVKRRSVRRRGDGASTAVRLRLRVAALWLIANLAALDVAGVGYLR